MRMSDSFLADDLFELYDLLEDSFDLHKVLFDYDAYEGCRDE